MSTNIECKLIRKGGTIDEVGGNEYHFTPWSDGAHVCAVADPEHADVFLRIAEGYRLYRGEGKPLDDDASAPAVAPKAAQPEPVAAPIKPAETILLGGDFPATFDIDGKTWDLGTVVAQAHAATGLSAELWNELDQGARDSLIEAELDRIDGEKDTKAELVEEYTKLYGKKPHHNLGVEKLKEAIAAKQ